MHQITFLIYLSAWLSKGKLRSKNWSEGLLPFLFMISLVSSLLIFQPSTSIAVIICLSALITYFLAGARIRFLVVAVLLGLIGFAILVSFSPYRMERIKGFLYPKEDQLGRSYHLNQAQNAIGSGGLNGVGYGQSTTKLNSLPEPLGDSIFAVIGEEFGFIGSSALVLFFLLLIWRGLSIAKRATDNFGKFLAVSFISLIGLQAFFNIGAISGVIPLTGVPLPFISYGGTALAVFLTMSGIIFNISKYQHQ